MLTAWMISQQERLARSPRSAETEQLLQKYSPRSRARDRQLDELTLVAVHGVFLFLGTAVLVLLAWLTSLVGARANATFATIYAGMAGGLCTALFVHLARYYDALICRVRTERRAGVDGGAAKGATLLRWPRASSDADLLVVIAVSASIIFLGR
jgi:hypothetical protein